jgi:hypothetical protein
MEPSEQTTQPKPKGKTWFWVMLAILLAILALAALWFWQQRVVNMTLSDCVAKDLSLSIGSHEGTAGTVYFHAVVTNTSKHACKISGYPTTALLNASGAAIPGGVAMNNDAYPVNTIIVQPAEKAHAFIGVPDASNFNPEDCSAESTKLSFFLPGIILPATVGLTTPFVQKACPGYSVSAFLAGA